MSQVLSIFGSHVSMPGDMTDEMGHRPGAQVPQTLPGTRFSPQTALPDRPLFSLTDT